MKSAELKQYLQEQCSSYRDVTPEICEVSDLVRKRSSAFCIWERNHCLPGFACHHIWGRNTAPLQSWCNLVLLSTSLHEFLHQGSQIGLNVGLACEASCLAAKYRRQQAMLAGPLWKIETEQHKQHWCVDAMNAARATCVGWTTLEARVSHLHDHLEGTPFGDITKRLMELVCTKVEDEDEGDAGPETAGTGSEVLGDRTGGGSDDAAGSSGGGSPVAG